MLNLQVMMCDCDSCTDTSIHVCIVLSCLTPCKWVQVRAAGRQTTTYLASVAQVVNKTEVNRLGDVGVPFFGINLSVGLSLALPGFQTDMAKGLLNNMPQGVITLVGAKSPSDAVQARHAGADAVLLKKDMLTVKGQSRQDVRQMVEQLKYSMSGDD